MIIDFALADAYPIFRKKLSFLVHSWEFEETESRSEGHGCFFRYQKGNLILRFSFDYRENFYYFDFLTEDDWNGRTMLSLFKEKSTIENEDLNPDTFNPEKVGRMAALESYIEFIQRYREAILGLAD